MAMLTVRYLPDDVRRALRVQAALHGRKVGLTNEDFEVFQQVRDKTPTEPLRFE